jgi:hypothetical protein
LSKDDFYTPTDMDALRMENELLAFEVRFLRTLVAERVPERVEELEHSAAQLKDRLEESQRRLAESERSAAQLRDRLTQTERAKQDIVLLLRRLANRPFRWFFGTEQDFRTLEQQDLRNDGCTRGEDVSHR